jgi:hypothetical protein
VHAAPERRQQRLQVRRLLRAQADVRHDLRAARMEKKSSKM